MSVEIEMMVSAHGGKVINYPDNRTMYEMQSLRKKLPWKDPVKAQTIKNIYDVLDQLMVEAGFVWLHSGLGKTERALRAIYRHEPSGYLFRLGVENDQYATQNDLPALYGDTYADGRVFWSDDRTPMRRDATRALYFYINVGPTTSINDIRNALVKFNEQAAICYAVK